MTLWTDGSFVDFSIVSRTTELSYCSAPPRAHRGSDLRSEPLSRSRAQRHLSTPNVRATPRVHVVVRVTRRVDVMVRAT